MTLIVAHRGFGEKETSLDSIQKAIESRVDMVEFDVRLTKDKQPVIFHGPPGAEGVSLLKDKTLDELNDRFSTALPTLFDVVEVSEGKIRLDVEIKEEGIEEIVLDALSHLDQDNYVITSFLDSVLIKIKGINPDIETGLITGKARASLKERFSEVFPEKRLAKTKADVLVSHRALFRANYPSFVWAVNEPKAIKKSLQNPRVRGIITDNPRLAMSIRDKVFST